MQDIKLIRENPEAFDHGLARRGVAPLSAEILALDAQRRAVATQMQVSQSRRNDASKAIGAAMGRGAKDEAEALKAEVAELKNTLPALEKEERELTVRLQDELARHGTAYVPFFPLGGFNPLQSSTLSAVAARLGATPMQVALAWLLRRAPNILLIPGTSSMVHLKENLTATEIVLSDDVVKQLDGVATVAA